MSSLASKQGPRYRHTSGEEAPFETIGVEKLTPIIGAENSGVDLSGVDVTHLRLKGLSLPYCAFREAKLAGMDLEGCDLTGCNFTGADLTQARLRGATLPFFQEIEFHPGPEYRGKFNELEVTFIGGPQETKVIFEADQKGTWFSEGNDATSWFSIPSHGGHDLVGVVQQQLHSLGQRRGWF